MRQYGMREETDIVWHRGFKYTRSEWDALLAKWRESRVDLAKKLGKDAEIEVKEESSAELKCHVDEHPLEKAVETVGVVATLRVATTGFRSTEENVKIRRYAPGGWY